MVDHESMNILRCHGLRPPRTLTIALTGVCNLGCSHCWVMAGESASAPHVPEETLARLVDEFAALGGEGVRFTGGEPLCHPAWLGLMQRARSAGLSGVSLQTNGMLLSSAAVAALRRFDFPGLSIQISLDGASAVTHDLVRGEGAFAAAVAGIRRLVDGGLARRVTIFFTEMRHNLQELPDLLELAHSLGVGGVVSGSLVLCGRAAEGVVAPPEAEHYHRLLDRFEADPRFRELYERIGTVAALEWGEGEALREECCTFAENPYLTPHGLLYPCLMCHADPFAVSGVMEKGLAEAFAEGAPLWSALLEISRTRIEALAECRECPGRQKCAGGCMGRAWGSCGDLQAPDDRCQLRREVYWRQSPSAFLSVCRG